MEGEEIGLVLVRASDLRSRISACAAAVRPSSQRDAEEAVKRLGAAEDEDGDEEEEEEVESLVGISDALVSLERQLAALQVDPFLRLVEDCRLQALNRQGEPCSRVYGSKEDDDLALKSLSNVSMNEDQSKETSVSLILNSLENLSELESSTIRKQLLEEFSAEDVGPLGSHFTETPSISPAQAGKLHQKSLEVIPMGFVFEDDTLIKPGSLAEPQSQHKLDSSLLDVSQLLESVSETAQDIGRLSVSTNHDLPFKELANKCEALLTGKQQKLSVCMSGHQKEDGETSMQELKSSEQSSQIDSLLCTADEQCQTNFCKLPVLSPYDQFLTHASC